MKTSHAALLGVGAIVTVGLAWAAFHQHGGRPKVGFGPAMRAPPPPSPPPPVMQHMPAHPLPTGRRSKAPFRRPTIDTNNIYHRKYKPAGVKGPGNTDAWGPDLMARQKRNNMEIYGSCNYC